MATKDAKKEQPAVYEKMASRLTAWIGSPIAIGLHTVFFVLIFLLRFFGFTIDDILLILTTIVSLEAIYLSLFIQMTVNRQAESLEDVEEDIDEIQDDIEEISEDIEQIQEIEGEERRDGGGLEEIEKDLKNLLRDIDVLRRKKEYATKNSVQ